MNIKLEDKEYKTSSDSTSDIKSQKTNKLQQKLSTKMNVLFFIISIASIVTAQPGRYCTGMFGIEFVSAVLVKLLLQFWVQDRDEQIKASLCINCARLVFMTPSKAKSNGKRACEMLIKRQRCCSEFLEKNMKLGG